MNDSSNTPAGLDQADEEILIYTVADRYAFPKREQRQSPKEHGICARPSLCQGQPRSPSWVQESNNGNRPGAPC
jgi:hypothetical protein